MREIRTVLSKIELETRDGEEAPTTISGYAATFEQPTELWPGHHEVVKRGAFTASLAGNTEDPAALWNHNGDFVLGRKSAGTLSLVEDEIGLRYSFPIPTSQSMRDMVAGPIGRGEVYQSSFQFEAVDAETISRSDGTSLRELRSLKLYDVSPVVFPAYSATSTQLRSLGAHPLEELREMLRACRAGGLTEVEVSETLGQVFGGEEPAPDPSAVGASLDALRRRIEFHERLATL